MTLEVGDALGSATSLFIFQCETDFVRMCWVNAAQMIDLMHTRQAITRTWLITSRGPVSMRKGSCKMLKSDSLMIIVIMSSMPAKRAFYR